MKAYKGFDENLKCKDFQYEIGKTYEEPEAQLCENGFNACEYPLDVFCYYSPAKSRFAEVELDDVSDEKSDDSERYGKKILVKAEIGIAGIVKASVDYIKEHATSAHGKTGYRSAATNTGDRSAATNTGDFSAATNTGDFSAATNTGDGSAATNTGYRSAATNTGKWGVASSLGIEGKAKGALGCWLVLAEWEEVNDEWRRTDVQCRRVDGETVKSDTFYRLENGEFVEASDDE
jgi:hypothetical protein